MHHAHRMIGAFDLLIAATARRHSLVLLTNNRRHFVERVHGLRIESAQLLSAGISRPAFSMPNAYPPVPQLYWRDLRAGLTWMRAEAGERNAGNSCLR